MTEYKANIAPFVAPFINPLPPQIYRFDVKYQLPSLTNSSPELRYEMCHSALFAVRRLYEMEMKP